MNQSTANSTDAPILPKFIGIKAASLTTVALLISAYNGADKMFFTDAAGNAITVTGTKKATTITNNPSGNIPDPQPPCYIHSMEIVDINWAGGNAAQFLGIIDKGTNPGEYTFYVRAMNSAGYSNVCVCTIEVVQSIDELADKSI